MCPGRLSVDVWNVFCRTSAAMNAAKAPEPHPRYVFMTGRMDPGESCIVLEFNTEEVFPREKSIRLELVEFDMCTDQTHAAHFGPPPTTAFPPPNDPYQPVVNVRIPAPLPALRRRRTDYYVPRMTRTWLPPLEPSPEEGEEEEVEEEEGQENPAKRQRKNDAEDDEEQEEGAAGYQPFNLLGEDEEGWFAPPLMDDSSNSSRRFKRAGFKDSKVQLNMQFKQPGARGPVLTNLGTDHVTYAKLVHLLNAFLANLEGRVFCNLHEHGPPQFSFVDEAGAPVSANSRQKTHLKLTLPPRSYVMFEEGSVWKLLGFRDERVVTALPKRGKLDLHAKKIRNSHDAQVLEFVSSVPISSTSYLNTAQGLTAAEWGRIGSVNTGFYTELSKISISWDTDHTLLSQPSRQHGSRPQKVRTSQFTLNQMVVVGLQALLLRDSALRFNVAKSENRLICSKAEMLKPDPSPINVAMTHVFSVDLAFGPEAARAMGLSSSTSPINVLGGTPFASIPNAFLDMDASHIDAQDGGGLSYDDYLTYLFNIIMLDAEDEKSDVNAQLDNLKRQVRNTGSFALPNWALQKEVAIAAGESAEVPNPNPISLDEAAAAKEVFKEIAAAGGEIDDPPEEAMDVGEQVVEEQNAAAAPDPTVVVDPDFDQDTPEEIEARKVLAERTRAIQEEKEKKQREEDLEQKRLAAAERERKQREEEARIRTAAEEERKRKEAAEEEARLRAAAAAEEEKKRKAAAEEEARLNAVAEEEKKRKAAAEEEARLKAAAEEEKKRKAAAEEEVRLKAAAEEEKKRKAAAEEEARLKAAAEEDKKLKAAAEEEARLQAAAEEEKKRKAAAEEEARLQAAAEEEKKLKAAAEEDARLKAAAEEEKKRKAAAEEEQRKLAAAEEEKRIAAAEEQARLKAAAEEEDQRKAAAAEEEEKKRKAEQQTPEERAVRDFVEQQARARAAELTTKRQEEEARKALEKQQKEKEDEEKAKKQREAEETEAARIALQKAVLANLAKGAAERAEERRKAAAAAATTPQTPPVQEEKEDEVDDQDPAATPAPAGEPEPLPQEGNDDDDDVFEDALEPEPEPEIFEDFQEPEPDAIQPPPRRRTPAAPPKRFSGLDDVPEETTRERENAENEEAPTQESDFNPAEMPDYLLNNEDYRMFIFAKEYEGTRWWDYFVKWETLLKASPELEREMNNFAEGLGSQASRRDPVTWGGDWIRWDRFFKENVESTPSLQRILQTEEERRTQAKDYIDVDMEPDFLVQLVNPPPPIIQSSQTDVQEYADEGTGYYGGGPDIPDDGAPYGDDDDEHLRLNPFDVVQEPNPIPQPPDVFNTWSNWPIPTCPPARNATTLPDFFMLLCRDGLRRDHVGAFGLDSLLAKIRHRRHITFKNYSIIRSPGRLNRLTFEVIDAGFNKVVNETQRPFLIRLGFIYHTLASESELIPYT